MLDWLKRHFTTADAAKPYRHLVPGRRYVVARVFADHDGIEHTVGEAWTFLRHSFLPYEDGLTLFLRAPDGQEEQLRLQGRPESEGAIIGALERFLVPDERIGSRVRIALTRDGVCLADDVEAPHAGGLDVDEDVDLVGIARALLASGYLAHVGGSATWWVTAGDAAVVFGTRHGLSFAKAVRPDVAGPRARDIATLHVGYAAQQDPGTVAARLRNAA